MTPEEVEKLQANDLLKGIRPIDPLLQGCYSYKGEVVGRTESGVIIRSDDPDDPLDGDLYGFSDPRLAEAKRVGSWQPGQPSWLKADKKRTSHKRPKIGRRSSRR
jgi:hypothetical protein